MDETLFVVYDACVLYPFFLRDFLVRLAIVGRTAEVLRAKWTGRIHREWMTAVLRENPGVNRGSLARTRRLMDRHVVGCRVRGYQRWEPRLTLPDPNDRHVLAAALACVADAIVTFNLKDFPHAALAPFGVAALTPDAFVSRFLAAGSSRRAVLVEMARAHRAALSRPPMTTEDYLSALRRNQLPSAADALLGETI